MSGIRTVADYPRNAPGLVDKFIGTSFDVVKKVSDNMDQVENLSKAFDEVTELSEQAATNATNSANSASASANSAQVSAAASTASSHFADNSSNSANAAAASASDAASSATSASGSASAASSSQTAAQQSAEQSASSATAAASSAEQAAVSSSDANSASLANLLKLILTGLVTGSVDNSSGTPTIETKIADNALSESMIKNLTSDLANRILGNYGVTETDSPGKALMLGDTGPAACFSVNGEDSWMGLATIDMLAKYLPLVGGILTGPLTIPSGMTLKFPTGDALGISAGNKFQVSSNSGDVTFEVDGGTLSKGTIPLANIPDIFISNVSGAYTIRFGKFLIQTFEFGTNNGSGTGTFPYAYASGTVPVVLLTARDSGSPANYLAIASKTATTNSSVTATSCGTAISTGTTWGLNYATVAAIAIGMVS